MKRTFLLILLVIVGGAVGGKYYAENKIDQQLKKIQYAVATKGTLDYDKVSITPMGDITITDVSFKPKDTLDDISVSALSLHAGNLFELIRLEKNLRQQEIPTSLRFSAVGINTQVHSDALALSSAVETSSTLNMGLFYCGDKDFTTPTLKDLGYSVIPANSEFSYNIQENAQEIEFKVKTTSQGFAKVEAGITLEMNGMSRNATVVAMALMQAKLKSISLRVNDSGYENRLLAYCAQQSNAASIPDYLPEHIAAWKKFWNELGIDAGSNAMGYFEDYIRNPKSYLLEIRPTDKLTMLELGTTPPNLLIHLVRAHLSVNGGASQVMDLISFQEQEAERERIAELDRPAPAPQVKHQSVAPEELKNYVQRRVTVELTSGKVYQGRITAADDKRLQLARLMSGGEFVQPISLTDISVVYLEPMHP